MVTRGVTKGKTDRSRAALAVPYPARPRAANRTSFRFEVSPACRLVT